MHEPRVWWHLHVQYMMDTGTQKKTFGYETRQYPLNNDPHHAPTPAAAAVAATPALENVVPAADALSVAAAPAAPPLTVVSTALATPAPRTVAEMIGEDTKSRV
jgi:hypothetical protein